LISCNTGGFSIRAQFHGVNQLIYLLQRLLWCGVQGHIRYVLNNSPETWDISPITREGNRIIISGVILKNSLGTLSECTEQNTTDFWTGGYPRKIPTLMVEGAMIRLCPVLSSATAQLEDSPSPVVSTAIRSSLHSHFCFRFNCPLLFLPLPRVSCLHRTLFSL
jgi:hypothetical protein